MKSARILTIWIALVFSCSALAQGPKTPIVLVTVDTLRADRVGCYGHAGAKTPVMDALALEGVLFDRAYVQTPITLPSHASILTGTYPMYHKVQDVVGRLRDGVPSITEVLQQAGYATGAFVGSTVLSSRWMLHRGFDVYNDYFKIPEGIRQVDFDRIERTGEEVLEPALEWLAKVEKRPFFLWLHLYDPHDPYTPPAPFNAEFRDRPYDGEIAYADMVIGKLVKALRDRGVYDKTLFVLTADHGESLGEHKEVHHGYFIYEASLKVPLIIRLPDGRYKGKRVSNTVRSVDIAPTILQALNQRIPASFQGESLLAMMAGKRESIDLPVYAETYYPKIHFNWSPLFGFVSGRHKYIDAPEPELYDVVQDPGELTNLLETNRALANRLKTELTALRNRYSAAGVPSDSTQVDPETVARLKALGYVALSAGSSRAEPGGELPDPKLKIQTYNLLNRGISLSRRGFSEQAVETFNQVARIEPNMPIVHFLLGMEYFAQKLFLKAAEELQTTLAHNPNSNVALFNLARAYLESGQSDKAEAGLKYLLEREPEHFAARHHLSLAYARRARYEEAAVEETKALELRPDFAEGHNNLGSFYLHLDKVDQAIGAYRKAISLEPKMLLARVNLTLAFIRKSAFDDAIAQAQEVVKIDPRRPLALFYLGQAYLGKGMKTEAREAFQKAKALNPSLNVPSIP